MTSLRKRYKEATEDGKAHIAELNRFNREKLKTLQRAENRARNRSERRRKRERFTANPFGYVEVMLDEKRSGVLKRRKRIATQKESKNYPRMPSCSPSPNLPKLTELQEVLKMARAALSPGPNAVPYRIYKNCLKLQKRLLALFKVVWRTGKMVGSWLASEGIFATKEEESKEINQFKTISLLNV